MKFSRWFGPALHAFVDLLAPPTCPSCRGPTAPAPHSGFTPSFCAACIEGVQRCRPPFCEGCGLPRSESVDRCPACLPDPGFRTVRAYGMFESGPGSAGLEDGDSGPLRRLVHAMKFDGERSVAMALGLLLAEAAGAELPVHRYVAVVPVPLHPARLARRGYNQSYLLARGVAQRHGLPLRSALRRSRGTAPQVGLPLAQRRSNLDAAFEVEDAAPWPPGAEVLLVDDVVTTGWTAAVCARALRASGVAEIDVLCVARTPLRHPSGLGLPPVLP